MEDHDRQRLNLEGLIRKLRSVTLAVQIMPFVYTSVYLVCMIFYWFASETVLFILDTLFFVSPIVVVQFLVLSRSLRLCRWHKIACSLPLIPQLSVILYHTIVDFSEYVAICSIATMMVMSILLLIAAYNVFLK